MTEFLMLPPQTDITRAWAHRLRADVPEISVIVAETAEDAARAIVRADAAFGFLPPDLLARAQRLRWLQAPYAAPPPGYYHAELVAHPVVVTNTREIYNDHIAAHVMACILMFARNLVHYHRQQFAKTWDAAPLDTGVTHLPDSTLLIVGVGGIGTETARLAASFGMRVIGTDARRTDKPDYISELHRADALDELLPRADFVVLTVPHTPATEGFMHRARFQRMKRSAIFINIGRGMTTRLADLTAALQAGEIAGAALDVYEQEPLPRDHPLWDLPNVVLTPHISGYGPYLDDRRYEILRHNCRAFARGEPLLNLVDKANRF
jgi:phosphoglycerate dehydrogenase-like enzyme